MYRTFATPLLNEFSELVDGWITLLNKSSKRALDLVTPHTIPTEIAQEKYNARVGETFYDFDVILTSEIVKAFEDEGFSYVSGKTITDKLLLWLSHYQTSLFIDGEKVLFCHNNRNVWFRKWDFKTGQEFQQYVQICQSRQIIDWSKANFYLNPFDRIIYISDMHERAPMEKYCVVQFSNDWTLPRLQAIGAKFKEVSNFTQGQLF